MCSSVHSLVPEKPRKAANDETLNLAANVGTGEGPNVLVGTRLGSSVGSRVGIGEGCSEMMSVGTNVVSGVGISVGSGLGCGVGAGVGRLESIAFFFYVGIPSS